MIISKDVFKELIETNDGKLIFKFTATWCEPCKRAAPHIQSYISKLPEDVKYFEIDIDESLDVYGMLKAKRIVSGVPSLICYYNENKSNWPDEAISSSDELTIKTFFDTVYNE